MFFSFLVIAVVGAVLIGAKRWSSLPVNARAAFLKKAVLYGAAAVVIALVLAGKAHWLMGVLAAGLALLGRVAQFAQYIPMFEKVKQAMNDDASNDKQNLQPNNTAMTVAEAADILGVESNSSKDEIKAAHKRLMQKLHPDRGGSEALSKQINLAKDVLLS